MKFKRLSRLQTLALVIFGFFAIRLIFFRAPSESQMIARFHEQKTEFEQLRSMLQQDELILSFTSNWVRSKHLDWPRNPEQAEIPPQKLTEYRSLIKKLGIALCVRNKRSDQGYWRFGVLSGGATDTSWSIGYAWSLVKLTPLVKSAYHELPRKGIHYLRIEGNWYIYHLR